MIRTIFLSSAHHVHTITSTHPTRPSLTSFRHCSKTAASCTSYNGLHSSLIRHNVVKLRSILVLVAVAFCVMNSGGLHVVSGIGSMSTIATSYDGKGGAVVCGIMQGALQNIKCWSSSPPPPSSTKLYALPNASLYDEATGSSSSSSSNGSEGYVEQLVSPSNKPFAGISGGLGTLCGIRADTGRPLCWETGHLTSPKRLKDVPFSSIVTGEQQVCGLGLGANPGPPATASNSDGALASCWRDKGLSEEETASREAFSMLAAGVGFVCGLTPYPESAVRCWGGGVSSGAGAGAGAGGDVAVSAWPNAAFWTIQAGSRHACGITPAFDVQCWGERLYGQARPPDGHQFLALALGDRHSCGIEAFSRRVICWGDNTFGQILAPPGLAPLAASPFLSISAADFFTCGVLSNLSVFCWGGPVFKSDGLLLPLDLTIPSPCTTLLCPSGSFRQSNFTLPTSDHANRTINITICSSPLLHVCTPCRIGCLSSSSQTSECTPQQDITCSSTAPQPPPSAPSPAPSTLVIRVIKGQAKLSKPLIALAALGSLGTMIGLFTLGWCLWAKLCGHSFDPSQAGRVHNSIVGAVTSSVSTPPSRPMRRQQSSTSSVRARGDANPGKAQAFSIAEMMAATLNFSDENKIATGSFGFVYRGILADGTEVAIKRREKETVSNDRKMEEKESAFESELEFLSRLHHKHLVSLVGYCDEEDERMLVYEYMPNGTLHDHLHGRGGLSDIMEVLPWQMRIKIALEAARGVEYLHTYAIPPIIHRDIKSSNILLDGAWNARVSDFGLSTRGPAEDSHLSLMAAGTLGYMDPEYYRLQHLTIKSDVYSFGVVLLEILTGERAIHKQSHGPVNIVDFAVPRIASHSLASILDQRPGVPRANEFKALEMIGQLAATCVQLEGKGRPTMTDIVAVLEEAMAYGSNVRSRSQSAAAFSSRPHATKDKSCLSFAHVLEAIPDIADNNNDGDDISLEEPIEGTNNDSLISNGQLRRHIIVHGSQVLIDDIDNVAPFEPIELEPADVDLQ